MFDKYRLAGAYHWRECDPGSPEFNPPLVARYDMILRRAFGTRVLDVGAGDGYLTARLANQYEYAVGVEAETSGIAMARKMLAGIDNVELYGGSVYGLPFADRSFDGVVLADVIEHLDRPDQAISEIARVLTRDGAAFVTTPQWRSDRIWDPRHVKEYRPLELHALLSACFKEVRLVFAWPRFWSDLYRTRLGWRLLRLAARHSRFNPFLRESGTAHNFCQMLAIARRPLQPEARSTLP